MPSSPHPSPELLVMYHEERLPTDQAEEVRAHLVTCADCAAQLLELADLIETDGSSAAEDVSPQDLTAAWERQRRRLFPGASVAHLEQRRESFAPRRWSWGLAASLALATGLGIIVLAQWRTIEHLKKPQANPPLVNLVPVGALQRGSERAVELRVPAGAERAWVILNPSEPADRSAYEVALISSRDGKTVWLFHGLLASEAGNFRLEVPRALLRPGSYRLRLREEQRARPRASEVFELTVRQ